MNARVFQGGARVSDSGFIARFAGMLLVIFSLGGISLFIAFYVILMQPLPSTYSGMYFALRNLSAFLVPMLSFSMVAYFLVVSVAVAILCGFAFHRIAGPLYRMERALENFESGDSVRAVFLRDGDLLAALPESYNRFIEHLRENRREWISAMEHADRLCFMDSAACRAARGEALARLSDLLSRYR